MAKIQDKGLVDENEQFEQIDSSEVAPVSDKSVIGEIAQATHIGEIKIGNTAIQCAVLEDGTRVLTQRSFLQALGRSLNPSGTQPEVRPAFLNADNLEPFIDDELRSLWSPILFRSKRGGGSGGVSYGYKAELLPRVCNVYLDAEDAGKLTGNQKKLAQQCRVLIRAFATIGILALVDEVTGYQEDRDKHELQRILEAYIAKELLPWTQRFPDEFYKEMFRLKKWQYSPMRPQQGPRFAGKLTNQIVYERLPPGVLEELRKKNPIIKDGRRRYKQHQYLTPNTGQPHLDKLLAQVIALMRISKDWTQFTRFLERAVPKPNAPIQPELLTTDDDDIYDPEAE